jgi:LAGLIDADG endonuclease
MNISKTEIAYLAGFVDGEGCLAINKRLHKNKIGSWIGYSAYIDLTSTNKEVMEYIRSKFGITSNVYVSILKGNRKIAFRLRINKMQSQELIEKMYPFLIIKKAQAEVFIQFCKFSKNEAKREELWQQMALLNKRGKI